ncbi:tetratricopeptide repeat protein, partial [Candidatus Thorarchaeota archaeon]
MGNPIQEELSEAKTLIEEGRYNESLRVLERILEKLPDTITVLNVLNLKSEICWRSGKLDVGLEVIKVTNETLSLEEMKTTEVDADLEKIKSIYFSNAGIIHWYLGNLEIAREYHEKSLKINQDLEIQEGISKAYNNLGLVYWSKGNLDIATDYYKKSLANYEDLNDENGISRVLNNLANISASHGKLDQALIYHQRSLSIKERIASKQDIAQSLINMGVIYRLKGSYHKAREYYNRSLAIQENLSIGPEFALAMNNLGEIYSLTGELNTALDFYQRSLLLYESMGNKEGIALTLTNIGDIYIRKGESDIAFEYFNRSLSISEEICNRSLIATSLSELINLALDRKDTNLAEDYMTRFNQVNEESDSNSIDQKIRMCRALILKKSTRMRDRVKAEEILEGIIEEDISDNTVTCSAMIHLCDLLLDELKATGEESTLNKIKGLTQKLVEIAQDQSSPILLVETYLLQSKLAIVAFEFEQARELMARGHSIAVDRGLERLSRIVESEMNHFQYQQKKWKSVLETNPSKQEMIDMTNLNELLERMVQKTVETLGIDSTIKPKYELIHKSILSQDGKTERNNFRVGIAQIGLSNKGDILSEHYEEYGEGLIRLKDESIQHVKLKVKEMVNRAQKEKVNVLIFPEMSIDLMNKELADDIQEFARKYEMVVIPGSFHEQNSKRNLSR